MAAHAGDKHGLEHLNEYDPKTRLVVVLEGATLETVKVGKTFELLNCDQHKSMIIRSGRDPGKIRPDITHQNINVYTCKYFQNILYVCIFMLPVDVTGQSFEQSWTASSVPSHREECPQRLLRLTKNPVLDHLPPGCPRYSTSFKAGDAVCPTPLNFSRFVILQPFVNVGYTEKTVSISNYPQSAALTCAKMCSAFEEVWGV
uniref:EMG1 N1-specific pseudouridine methyltransferase n=1 Tax=Sinocyclocheilus grahami TaxID=75366 RepID=A0A672PH68_SINGR